MTYSGNLSLFSDHCLKNLTPRRPRILAICPVCKTIFVKRNQSTACSPACRTTAKFWRSVRKTDDCWWWVGDRHKGYGRFAMPEQKLHFFAHRYSYALHIGPIPDGYEIDHLCKQPLCVRPDHLEAVTRRENWNRGRSPSAVNRYKTHCKHGHPFDAENTRYVKAGRYCYACRQTYARKRQQR